MLDLHKIDSYFNQEQQLVSQESRPKKERHSQLVHLAKIFLPSFAALLIGLLAVFPAIQNSDYDFKLDITKPKAGELEKLHMENSIFNITDKNNKVQNFTAQKVDETKPGSKLIKLTFPDGTLPNRQGQWTNVKSPIGFFNQLDNTLKLQDGVELFYSEGMSINVADFHFDFKKHFGFSNQHVSGQGIFGKIEAEGVQYDSNKSLLVFTGKTYIKFHEESFKSRK